jgi:mycofactocin system glycosyltransferase
MKGFGFSLAAGISLRESPEGYFLLSRLPVRILRTNRSLFELLRHIREGGELSEFINRNPGLSEANLLRTLFSLSAKGYLKLDRLAEIQSYPTVSIVIPVRDQPGDLGECLASLAEMDYPQDSREIIVVDDGSKKDVSRIIMTENIRFIRLEKSLGPAAARNIGAEKAGGDILAFIDADCTAGEKWLGEISPFFQAGGVGAVGGRVAGYYEKGFLDRYEATSSSLHMGSRLLLEGKSSSTFYVPTANLLVRRDVFISTGGFRSRMRIGEDVDFCWRLRSLGHTLLYVPFGAIAHKHRHRLDKMLLRRAQYGMSEAPLYRSHRDKRKSLPIPIFSGLSLLALVLAIMLLNPYPLCAIPLLFGLDLWMFSSRARKYQIGLSFPGLVSAALRSTGSFFHFAFFHLVRYYLVLFIGLGILWYPLWILGGLALVYASVIDYLIKKPALFYPVFLFFYLLEHLWYQGGVFWGCLRQGYFGSYILRFRYT